MIQGPGESTKFKNRGPEESNEESEQRNGSGRQWGIQSRSAKSISVWACLLVWQAHDQKQLGLYFNLQFHILIHHWGKLGRNSDWAVLEAEPACSQWLSRPAFLHQDCLARGTPTHNNLGPSHINHQSKGCITGLSTGQSCGRIFSVEILSP